MPIEYYNNKTLDIRSLFSCEPPNNFERAERTDISLFTGDILEKLNFIHPQQIDLIVSSPPYNIGKSYEEKQPLEDYLNWIEKVIKGCDRVLKLNGSICWQLGAYHKDKELFPLDFYYYQIMKKFNYKLKNRIIWNCEKMSGSHGQNKFSGRYETISWFIKSDDYTFNLDPIRVPQKYPNKKTRTGEKATKGKNPTDYWAFLQKDWEEQVWTFPNVGSGHVEQTIHPAMFPIELPERLILALTNEGDTILDPFCGSGSALVAGILWNRKVYGIDYKREYTDLSLTRIKNAIDGKIKKRPLLKPIQNYPGVDKIYSKTANHISTDEGVNSLYTTKNNIYNYHPIDNYTEE